MPTPKKKLDLLIGVLEAENMTDGQRYIMAAVIFDLARKLEERRNAKTD